MKTGQFIFLSALVLLLATRSFAQPTEPWENEGQSLSEDPITGDMTYEWWGKSGRTYFIQSSEDLMDWTYIPIIEPGGDDWVEWGFSFTADSIFLRLKFSDIPTTNPNTADFDGDDIGNWDELLQETDPFAALDLDANSLPDDWELFWGSEIAVFPTPLELTLDWGGQEMVSLYLNNPTTSAANYSAAVSGETVAGYSWEDSLTGTISYSWTDISTSGTLMTGISDVDNDSQAIQLTQFTLPFYGRDYSEVWVASNGYLNFKAENNDSSQERLPDMGQPYGMIAPFWTDLHTGEAGDIYFKEEASRLIIQFEGVKQDSYTGTNSFQVILNDDGLIEFHYEVMGGSNLNFCTVGIENSIGNQGIPLRYNSDASNHITLQDNYAIRFSPTKTLYTLAPLSGAVPAESPTELVASFNTDNVIPGTYSGSIAVTHDGVGTSPWTVPVSITIPYAKMVYPAPGTTIWEGEDFSTWDEEPQARVVDTPSPIDRVEFYFDDDQLISQDTQPAGDLYDGGDWDNPPPGEHQIFARVVMDNAQTSDSAPITVTVIPDGDGDRMPDEWEAQIVQHDSNDSFFTPGDVEASADFDGDGFPNIFEYHHGTDPADSQDYPIFSTSQSTVSPEPEIGPVNYFKVYSGAPNSGYEWDSIQTALNIADNDGEGFDIIEVFPGTYNENISLDERVYLFSRDGARSTIIDGTDRHHSVIDLGSESVIEGFTIQNGGSTTSVGFGAGLYILISSEWKSPRIIGCIFINNLADEKGGAVYVRTTEQPVFIFCTMVNNHALYGRAIFVASGGKISLENTLLWNPSWGFEEIFAENDSVVMTGTILLDDASGNMVKDGVDQGTSDIGFTPWFGIYDDSAARDAGTPDMERLLDMDGETAVDQFPDIGADEYIDSDADGMADSWEDYYGVSDPNGNADSDALTNLEEFQNRTNPLIDDTDGDTVSDSDEVNLTLTDPTVPDLFGADGDSNNDGLDDGIGYDLGIAIGQADSDGDGVSNDDERSFGTNPFGVDSDGDGESDATDPFPLDASLDSSDFINDPGDATAPLFLLTKPVEAIEI